MQSSKKDDLILVRLFPGEDIFAELEKACGQYSVKSAIVVSGIGQLKEFRLGFFREKGNYVPELFSQVHELISLTGNICDNNGIYEFHLHASLGDQKKNVIGGHLIEGKVEVTNEIALLVSEKLFTRKTNEKTGLREMSLD